MVGKRTIFIASVYEAGCEIIFGRGSSRGKNLPEEVLEKMREYFQAGTRLVWFVFSVAQEVYAYTTPTTTRIFTRADDLTADPVLPGFKLPLANLFEEGTED